MKILNSIKLDKAIVNEFNNDISNEDIIETNTKVIKQYSHFINVYFNRLVLSQQLSIIFISISLMLLLLKYVTYSLIVAIVSMLFVILSIYLKNKLISYYRGLDISIFIIKKEIFDKYKLKH